VTDSTPPAIALLAERQLATKFGTWREILYYNGLADSFALVHGQVANKAAVPCRVHSACLSAHVFNSVECDCREQMAIAQAMIQDVGYGVIIWLDQEGRGNGHLALMLAAKLSAELGIPQTEAYRRLGYGIDQRGYLAATAILRDLNVASVRLISNSPAKASALTANGIDVIDMLPVAVDLADYPQLRAYYADKAERGHAFPAIHRD
jgi:GTP cyclohydrolase II